MSVSAEGFSTPDSLESCPDLATCKGHSIIITKEDMVQGPMHRIFGEPNDIVGAERIGDTSRARTPACAETASARRAGDD